MAIEVLCTLGQEHSIGWEIGAYWTSEVEHLLKKVLLGLSSKLPYQLKRLSLTPPLIQAWKLEEPRTGTNPDIELDFNTKIKFIRHNTYGAFIYKDPSHRFLVKIEDHPTEFNASPFVNYQGDRYIGPQGEMYQVVDDPDAIDSLGGVKVPQPHEGDELPPRPLQEGVKLVNSIVVRIVPLDNPTKALYRQIR